MLQTFAILLIFQSIGEVISYALHLPVPGPVIGMILLFGWLVFDDRLLPVIQPTTGELLKHLSLLFVPAGVGIMVHARRIEGEWLPIAVAPAVDLAGDRHRRAGHAHADAPCRARRGREAAMTMTPRLNEIWVYLAATPLLGLTATLLAYVFAHRIYERARFRRWPIR